MNTSGPVLELHFVIVDGVFPIHRGADLADGGDEISTKRKQLADFVLAGGSLGGVGCGSLKLPVERALGDVAGFWRGAVCIPLAVALYYGQKAAAIVLRLKIEGRDPAVKKTTGLNEDE